MFPPENFPYGQNHLILGIKKWPKTLAWRGLAARRRRDGPSFASDKKVPPRSHMLSLGHVPTPEFSGSSGVWTSDFISIGNRSSRSWLQRGCSSNCKDASHLWALVRTTIRHS